MKTTAMLALAMLSGHPFLGAQEPDEDPLMWLEDVLGERALSWVKEQNARLTPELEARPEFKPIYRRTLEILDSKEKIPVPSLLGTTVYNFWKDERHERGIWRRTSVPSYRTSEPTWETVIDVDALAEAEKTPWVFKGAECLPPAYRRCLVSLSRGGADAAVVREFDSEARTFVEGGFSLPEAKSAVSWRDQDSIWVGTDFGPGSLTTSGYPRLAKLWKRGTPLAEARVVFAGRDTDVVVTAFSQHTSEGRYDFVQRIPAFYRQQTFLVLGDRLVKLDVPEDADFKLVFKDQAIFSLRSDWSVRGQNLRAGSLISIDLDDLLRGSGRFETAFEPSEHVFLGAVASTRERVLVTTLDNVRSQLRSLTFSGTAWARSDVALPGLGATGVAAASDEADVYFFSYEDFLTPSSLWLVEAGSPPAKVKAMPAFFNAGGMAVSQHEATSRDGTRIPYFVVTPKGFKADGRAPTLLPATAASRCRGCPPTRVRWAVPGCRAGVSSSWPTCAAGASSGRSGTRRPSSRIASRSSKTSSRWPTISWPAR